MSVFTHSDVIWKNLAEQIWVNHSFSSIYVSAPFHHKHEISWLIFLISCRAQWMAMSGMLSIPSNPTSRPFLSTLTSVKSTCRDQPSSFSVVYGHWLILHEEYLDAICTSFNKLLIIFVWQKDMFFFISSSFFVCGIHMAGNE